MKARGRGESCRRLPSLCMIRGRYLGRWVGGAATLGKGAGDAKDGAGPAAAGQVGCANWGWRPSSRRPLRHGHDQEQSHRCCWRAEARPPFLQGGLLLPPPLLHLSAFTPCCSDLTARVGVGVRAHAWMRRCGLSGRESDWEPGCVCGLNACLTGQGDPGVDSLSSISESRGSHWPQPRILEGRS